MHIVPILLIIGSCSVIARCIRAWLPRERLRIVIDAVNTSLQDGKYSGVALLFVSAVVDAILGAKDRSQHRRWRLPMFGLALLLTALSVGDLRYGSVLGTNESPWKSYDESLAIMVRNAAHAGVASSPETPEALSARLNLLHLLQKAQEPKWKYIYTGVIAVAVVLSTGFFLLMSLLLAKHVLDEIVVATSWIVRVGLILVLLLGSIFFSLACTLAIGVLCNPVVWIVLILAVALKSVANLVIGSALALGFEWWVSGPWFKVLITVSLLPSLSVLLVAIGDVVDGGRRLLVARSGQLTVTPTLERYGVTIIPLVATALIFVAIVLLLRVLP